MIVLLLVMLVSSNQTSAGDCGNFPARPFGEPGASRFTRDYENGGYGYHVNLPPGIVAFGELPGQPAHGVGIVLSWTPRSYLYLNGSHNALMYRGSRDAAIDREADVRRDSIRIYSARRFRTRLGHHPAIRSIICHSCNAGAFVTDQYLVLRGGIVYTLSLTAPPQRYRQDRLILNAIARSWRFTRIE